MSAEPKRDLRGEIRQALANPVLKKALSHAVDRVNALRRFMVARFPGYEEARDQARAIKERAIESLPEHIGTLERSVTARGGKVHHAEDAAAACRIVADIARQHSVRSIVKVKSMTSEEVHLNQALEGEGFQVRETDLGEFVVQLTAERPSHITAPIIHKSVEEVRSALIEGLHLDDAPHEPEELTQLVRHVLREQFLAADMGVSGANFVLADTGTVVVVTNEGNGRLATQLPRVHVVLAGIEKVLQRAEDLLPFLELLPRSATGQMLTSYLSFISGPGWGGSPFTAGEQRHFHLVLLDNGRTAMADDEVLREALYCIRCGACMTVCPPYQALGGHVYGGPTYHSGIGNVWEAGVRGLDTAAEFNELCTTCTRCQDVCPLHIDIPWMNTVLRDRIGRDRRPRRGGLERSLLRRLLPDSEDHGLKLRSRFFANTTRVYGLARATAPVSRWLARLWPSRWLLRGLVGLDPRRHLPLPGRTRLADWHRGRGGLVVTDRDEAKKAAVGVGGGDGGSKASDARTVALLADCHTDHLDLDVGRAAIETLERLEYRVVLVAGQCCGRAALSQGMIATARQQAEGLQEVLRPLIAAGVEVIGIEPSCMAALVDDHPKLLPAADRALDPAVGACSEILCFLRRELERRPSHAARGVAGEGRDDREADPAIRAQGSSDQEPVVAVFHGHCQQKTLGWLPAAVRLLGSLPGVEVRTTVAECCGMAGSFGFKVGFADVSIELGDRLLAEMDGLAREGGDGERLRIEYLACGTSCRSQILDLGRRARHPIELVAERLEVSG